MDIEPAVVDALRAIVAGTPVDWTALGSSRSEESLRNVIRDLKLISQIADIHRTIHDSGDALSSTTDAPVALAIQTIPTWGTLTLLERVGAGSFGEVYRAWDPRLDRE